MTIKTNKLKLPSGPGVYLFKIGRRVLYVGKATSLRDRVRSYFSKKTVGDRGKRIAKMVVEADSVAAKETDSVLEALILEAALIKKYQPKYNVRDKDDKSFNYLMVTKEDFPRVLVVRGRELLETNKYPQAFTKALFGPFPNGGELRSAIKIIRRIFPFRDRCIPGSAKPCFNRQLGLCPGVCTGEVSVKEYSRKINQLILFLSGKKQSVVRTLTKQMNSLARLSRFEAAASVRRQLSSLRHIQDVALLKRTENFSHLAEQGRLEGYDVAHTAGAFTVGAMTVVVSGNPEPNWYRRFKLYSPPGDDLAALEELIARRFAHPEWPPPSLIVVDGGNNQRVKIIKTLASLGINVPVVSVVKDEHHRPKQILGDQRLFEGRETAVLLVNAEAHRFALSYHRRLRRRLI